MDITQFIEKHGKPAFTELLNIIFISDWRQPDGSWRMYCLRHGMVTRNTKTVRCWYGNVKDNHWYTVNGEYKRWDKPERQYTTILKNGSGKTIFSLVFNQEQLEEWKQRETNPNQTES